MSSKNKKLARARACSLILGILALSACGNPDETSDQAVAENLESPPTPTAPAVNSMCEKMRAVLVAKPMTNDYEKGVFYAYYCQS